MHPAVQNILTKHFTDRSNDPDKAVLLASSGRAGSTWVAQVINYRNDYRLMFEPFREDLVPEAAAFRLNQYIRPGDSRPELYEAAKTIFAGRVRHDWIDVYNRRLFCSRRLVKDIRVNLFLKWIRVKFPRIPVIFLMRHPCAVAKSRMDLGWLMSLEKRFLSQPELVEDLLAPFEPVLRNAHNEWDRQIMAWCVENYVPLVQCGTRDIHVVFYENFCLDPAQELSKLGAFLGTPFDSRVNRILVRPSYTVRTGQLGQGFSSVVKGDNLIDAWRSQVSRQELERAVEILTMFGLDTFYGAGSTPRADAVEAGVRRAAGSQARIGPVSATP
jgi:Sulfotransferase family